MEQQLTWLATYEAVRRYTELICQPLSPEECMVQACEDVSPAKWHLAHTSWFFDRFLLRASPTSPSAFDPHFDYIFNSYYEGAGAFHPRARRGILARPSSAEVQQYRRFVDTEIVKILQDPKSALQSPWHKLLEIGLHHEQQHQELLLSDIKFNAYAQPQQKAPYPPLAPAEQPRAARAEWVRLPSGLHTIGQQESGFGFDNEYPAHPVFIGAVALASRPVHNGEYLAFIDDRGYERSEFWLSEGWQWCKATASSQPLYWQRDPQRGWQQFTLHGWRSLQLDEPVCHLNLYEADAFARWSDARLPSEQEWEVFARCCAQSVPSGSLDHMQARAHQAADLPFYGEVWEWTQSSYSPYPGYRPWTGAIAEYNGKFMINQYVLRGGSCASPPGHIRPSYRNFYPAPARWAFSGLRLAKDLT